MNNNKKKEVSKDKRHTLMKQAQLEKHLNLPILAIVTMSNPRL
jgi:hypothetical protein